MAATLSIVCPMHSAGSRPDLSCGPELVEATVGLPGVHRSGAKVGQREGTWDVAPCASLLAQGWTPGAPQAVLWASDTAVG